MKKILLSMLIAGFASLPLGAQACTLYGAQGDAVEGGGSIITKIRDFRPQAQSLRVVKSKNYSYFGLFSGENRDKQVIKAGVNEKGLTVVTAMAGSIPKKQRDAMAKRPCTRKILANCATVEEALQHPDYYFGPRFVMIADAKEIAYVEIGNKGEHKIKRTKNNTLTHTNHYLESGMEAYNIKIGPSSMARYNRINELVNSRDKLSFEDFKTFSQDQNAGPDNSIWRLGSKPGKSETLAAFIVRIYDQGEFQLWLKYRPEIEDKGKEEIVVMDRKDMFGY